MEKEGVHVIHLEVGEPDFDTPDFIKQVAIEDIQKGVTKYTDSSGTPDLRRAVCAKLRPPASLV